MSIQIVEIRKAVLPDGFPSVYGRNMVSTEYFSMSHVFKDNLPEVVADGEKFLS